MENNKNPEAKAYFKILAEVKEYYLANQFKIIQHHEKYPLRLMDAYPFDWNYIMNEIEQIAWSTMRVKGNMPLYPQFPALQYYLDFANPILKIAVEIDGLEFHERDKDRDRDLELKKQGWRIFRIPGQQMVKTTLYENWGDLTYFDHKYDSLPDFTLEWIKHWIMGTGDGVLEAIKVIYFKGDVRAPDNYIEWFRQLCKDSLSYHTIIRHNE